ncbi:YafY family protein [Bacillus nakamurai]|uniref:Transcriptional regulator n=1 Tax=Bacillus nakamurai TaxID=1793963 RepID=A0A150F9Q2_9BACI|nr:YafY family protein [Bacillus nakamurai]KXZ21749.1 transcriptional regulator [Bacillus nakamurai]MED1226625.1 YafY family protein [Bacillus nakamurai]
MKLERLLAIIVLLISKKQVQAAELAEMFEVSVRTIYRDIDVISRAGIPIITSQGFGGGIQMTETYRMEREWLKEEELAVIASALKSVSSVYEPYASSSAIKKIQQLVPVKNEAEFKRKTEKWFFDMTPWGHTNDQKNLLHELLSGAIDHTLTVSFIYTNAKGETMERQAEPYTLVCKTGRWYLYAFCLAKQDFRFFKLSRMKSLSVQTITFERKDVQLDTLPWDAEWYRKEKAVSLELLVHSGAQQRLGEWFGYDVFHFDKEGSCRAVISFPENQWLIGFLLQFGKEIEILSPLHIREQVKETIQEMKKRYET